MGAKDILEFQDRITSNVELLDAYLRRVSNKDNVESMDNNGQTTLRWAAQKLNDNTDADADVNVDVISKSSGSSKGDDGLESPKVKSAAEVPTSGQPFSVNQENL